MPERDAAQPFSATPLPRVALGTASGSGVRSALHPYDIHMHCRSRRQGCWWVEGFRAPVRAQRFRAERCTRELLRHTPCGKSPQHSSPHLTNAKKCSLGARAARKRASPRPSSGDQIRVEADGGFCLAARPPASPGSALSPRLSPAGGSDSHLAPAPLAKSNARPSKASRDRW